MALFFRSGLTSHRSAKITEVGGVLVTVTVCWVFLLSPVVFAASSSLLLWILSSDSDSAVTLSFCNFLRHNQAVQNLCRWVNLFAGFRLFALPL